MNFTRMQFLDNLKAFAIITVVIYHIGGGGNIYMDTMIHFQMPIFFIVSGYLIYKKDFSPWVLLKKRTIQLLLPLFFCGALLCLNKGSSYVSYLVHEGKFGYWFLLTLFECSAVYAISHICSASSLFRSIIIDACTIVILIGLRYICSENVIEVLGLRQLAKFYPVLLLGTYLRRYDNILEWCSSHTWIFIMLAIYYVLCQDNMFSNRLLYYFNQVGHGMASSLFCFVLFRHYDRKIPFDRLWNYLGRNSLTIYLLHFFFLFPISQYITPYFAANLFVVIICTSSIILSSLVLGKVIGFIPLLKTLLLGQYHK